MRKEIYNGKNKIKEDEVINATAISKIDKTNITDLTLDKKKILKSLQGIASSSVDFIFKMESWQKCRKRM